MYSEIFAENLLNELLFAFTLADIYTDSDKISPKYHYLYVDNFI